MINWIMQDNKENKQLYTMGILGFFKFFPPSSWVSILRFKYDFRKLVEFCKQAWTSIN